MMNMLSISLRILTALLGMAGPDHPLDTKLDDNLAKRVSVRANRSTVAEVLAEVAKEAGLNLIADESVAPDRVYVYATRVRADSLLDQLARAHRWQWERTLARSSIAYRLLRPESVKAEEEAEQARWRKGRETLANARAGILSSLMQKAIDLAGLSPEDQQAELCREPWLGKDFFERGGRELTGVLGSLSPDERSAIAESCLQDGGTISATNQSHVLRNMTGNQPLANFSADQQAGLRQYAQGSGSNGDLSGANVGLYAANGSINLAVQSGDNAWLSGTNLRAPDSPELYDATRRAVDAAISGKVAEFPDANTPEHAQLLANKYGQLPDVPLADDLRIPRSYDRRTAIFDQVKERSLLGGFLEAFHNQTGIPIVADGLIHSSRNTLASILGGHTPYSLRDALAEMCVRFRRKIRQDNGCLIVSSRRYAIYRLYETPDAQISDWLERRKSRGAFSFEDVCRMAAGLSDEQLDTLAEESGKEARLPNEVTMIRRYRSLFSLWNSVSDVQRAKLESSHLPIDQLSGTQVKDFWRACIRASSKQVPKEQQKTALSMACDASTCSFTFMTPKSRIKAREVSLPLPRDRFLTEAAAPKRAAR